MMSNYIYRIVGVTEREVFEYVKSTDTSFAVPEVRLRVLRMGSLDAMSEALRDLEAGTPFQKVVERWAPDPAERKRLGVTEYFPVTERAPLGEIAWQMDVGQVYGPVRDSSGVVMLELLGKKNVRIERDTSYAARLAGAKHELVRMKQRRAKNLFLAQVAVRQGYAMFQDRLTKLEVTTLPMLAFRLLGFGGRMFAAPFVEKNLEWLDIEPPEGIIVP
jgi:parvulin-like peptidyl-prolyl isomerase